MFNFDANCMRRIATAPSADMRERRAFLRHDRNDAVRSKTAKRRKVGGGEGTNCPIDIYPAVTLPPIGANALAHRQATCPGH